MHPQLRGASERVSNFEEVSAEGIIPEITSQGRGLPSSLQTNTPDDACNVDGRPPQSWLVRVVGQAVELMLDVYVHLAWVRCSWVGGSYASKRTVVGLGWAAGGLGCVLALIARFRAVGYFVLGDVMQGRVVACHS